MSSAMTARPFSCNSKHRNWIRSLMRIAQSAGWVLLRTGSYTTGVGACRVLELGCRGLIVSVQYSTNWFLPHYPVRQSKTLLPLGTKL